MSVLAELAKFALMDENNNLVEPQALQIEEILKGDPEEHSRAAVSRMLKNPETMVLDDQGRLCLIFIRDSKSTVKREIWMIFAMPVAMAVYLRKFSYARKLIESGFDYAPMEHFQAYHIEGEMTFPFAFRTNICRLVSHDDLNICRYNNLTNLELMTCMADAPKWVVDGVWSELIKNKDKVTVFSNVTYNMDNYYKYTHMLACEKGNKGAATHIDSGSMIFSGDMQQLYTECFKRLNSQLARLAGLNIDNIMIDPGADYSDDICKLDMCMFEELSGNPLDMTDPFLLNIRFGRTLSMQGRLIESFYLMYTGIIWRQLEDKNASSKRALKSNENLLSGMLEYWMCQMDSALGNIQPYSIRYIRSIEKLAEGHKSSMHVLIKLMYIQYVRSKDRTDKGGRAYLKNLVKLMVDYGIKEKNILRDSMRVYVSIVRGRASDFDAGLYGLSEKKIMMKNFELKAVKEIRRELEMNTRKMLGPLILDCKVKAFRDYLINELEYINTAYTKSQELYIRSNFEEIDGVINFDILKHYSKGIDRLISRDLPELVIVLIRKGIITGDSIPDLVEKGIELGAVKMIPYLLAYEEGCV